MSRRVLVVTEDPYFIEEVRARLGTRATVSACLGPGHARCAMEERGICGLAQAADLALVDVPATGCFHDHYRGIPAISYAERLAETHPRTRVVMCTSVASTERSAFLPRSEALDILPLNLVP